MTTQADYTAEEWKSLLTAPVMAGMAITFAGQSGPIQMVKESFAVAQAVAEVEKQGSSNALISSVVAAMKTAKREDLTPPPGLKSTEEARTFALEQVRRAAALVDNKAPAQEAQEFKQWLASIGPKVAEAAKEGGFLGFGGTLVTEEEKAAMNDLTAALGVTPSS